jgi:hypothetical protein
MQTRLEESCNGWWRAGLLAAAAMLLTACAGQSPAPTPPVSTPEARPIPAPGSKPPVLRPPIERAPISAPIPQQPSTTQRTHPRYAPPPGAPSHWDNRLGVYVVEGASLYYRERLYYRWDGDWYCAGRPDGPWEPVEPHAVPPGLRNRPR